MPRGKKELAEQIIPKLREVEVEVGRGKTVLSVAKNRNLGRWPTAHAPPVANHREYGQAIGTRPPWSPRPGARG